MTKLKQPNPTASLEQNRPLGDTFTLPIPLPLSETVQRDARITRAVHIRAVFTRVRKILTSGALDELMQTHLPQGRQDIPTRPKSA